MKIGLVGLPGSGKSTVFRTLTGKHDHLGHAGDVAVVHVPDPRTERLAAIYGSQRIVQPEITFLDLMAVRRGDGAAGEALDLVRLAGDADAFVLVLQCFGDLDYAGNPLRPGADFEAVLLEMALTDLTIVENRLKRIAARGGKREAHEHWEEELLRRCQAHLAAGGSLRDLPLSEDEAKHLRGFSLVTLKPWLMACNVAEDDLTGQRCSEVHRLCEQRGLPYLDLCATLEEEIGQLPPEEQASFAADFGLTEPARERLLHLVYRLMRLVTFFTVNEKEAHAWTITAGATALAAAGKVHSDMQHGFIRAEVIPFACLDEMGSEKVCKERGLMRVEGRDYVVQDGDVLYIRFSR